MFGTPAARQRFFDLTRRELDRRRVPWEMVSGEGSRRLLNAIEAIHRAGVTA